MLADVIIIIDDAILAYFVILSCGYISLLIPAIPQVFRNFTETRVAKIVAITDAPELPPVTVIIPAFNEEDIIIDTVESVLKNKYSKKFIIVVDPSSTDNTLNKLIDKYNLHPVTSVIPNKIKTYGAVKNYYISKIYKNLTVINKEHTDRSDTLNVGVNACRTPLFITLDADTLMESDTINNILFYMLSNANMLAVGGAVFVLNGCSVKDGVITSPDMSLKPLLAFQTCEYLKSFYFAKTGWNVFNGSLSYAGALTLFEQQAVIDIGGYQLGNLSQDFEIITHLHEHEIINKIPYKMGYTPSAAVWTDVPGTLKAYWKQRKNWQYSILQSLMSHKKLLNPKYGLMSAFTFAFFLFGETLSAMVEFMAYVSVFLTWLLGILDTVFAIFLFLLCWGFQVALSVASTLMSYATFNRYMKIKYLLWRLFYCLIEVFGFRQFGVICRVVATFSYFFKALKFSKIKSHSH